MAVAGGLVGTGLDVWRTWLVPLMRHGARGTERFTNAAGWGPVSGTRLVDSQLAVRRDLLGEIDCRSGLGGISTRPAAGCMASEGDRCCHADSHPDRRTGLAPPLPTSSSSNHPPRHRPS